MYEVGYELHSVTVFSISLPSIINNPHALTQAVKTEVNVPILREFVDALYVTAFDMTKRKKNIPSIFPLITCLLCISQKQFFLVNWGFFLDTCLTTLKVTTTATTTTTATNTTTTTTCRASV